MTWGPRLTPSTDQSSREVNEPGVAARTFDLSTQEHLCVSHTEFCFPCHGHNYLRGGFPSAHPITLTDTDRHGEEAGPQWRLQSCPTLSTSEV